MSSLIEDNRVNGLLQINKAHLNPSANEFLENKSFYKLFLTCHLHSIVTDFFSLRCFLSIAVGILFFLPVKQNPGTFTCVFSLCVCVTCHLSV